jgi:hypothetical protein
MLKSILNLKGANLIAKSEQVNILGGMNSCIRECRQDFADCREDGHSHCTASLAVCKSRC